MPTTKSAKKEYKPNPTPPTEFDVKQHLATILEGLAEGVTAQDISGNVIYANQIAATLLGYTSVHELVGTRGEKFSSTHLVLDEEGNQYPKDKLPSRLALAGIDSPKVTVRFQEKLTGTEKWIRIKATPIFDTNGNVSMVVNVLRDITERRQNEAELTKNRERLELAQQAAGIGTFEWNVQTGEIIWSPELEHMFGLKPGTFPGTYDGWKKFVFPGDVTQTEYSLAEAMKHKTKVEVEYRVFLPNGQERWIQCKGSFEYNARGKATRMLGVNIDITKKKQTEQALRKSETINKFLAEAGNILSSSLDYEETLKQVANLAVPELADWCSVDIKLEDESVQQLAVAHKDPKKVKFALELRDIFPYDPKSPTGVAAVLRTGKPEFIPQIPDHLLVKIAQNPRQLDVLRKLHFTAVITVPLKVQKRVFGAISFVSAESEREYTLEDLRFAEELARRASLAIENARLYHMEKSAHKELESVIEERTQEMRKANEILKKQIVERIQNLEALKEKEQLLRTVLDTLPVAVWVTDNTGKIILENPAGQELWAQKTFIGVDNFSAYKTWWADSGKRVEPEEFGVFRALTKGETVLYEVMNIEALDGEKKTILNSVYPMHDEYDKIIGTIVVNEDITDRQQSAEELDNSRKELREYIDHMTTFNMKLATDGRILLSNSAAQIASGLPFNQLLKTNFLEGRWFTFDPDVSAHVGAMFQKAASGTPVAFIERAKIMTGDVLTLAISFVPVLNKEDKVQYIIAEGHDVTAQQRAEERLKRNEAMLQEAQKIAHIGSWEWDVFYNVVTWSDEMCSIYGQPKGYHGGYEDFLAMVHPQDQEGVRKAIEHSLKKKKPFDFYHRILRNDGTERILHAQGNLALNNRGDVITFFGTGQDVTEQHKAQEQLRMYTKKLELSKAKIQQEKAKDEAILSSLGEGIIATDKQGTIIMINPHAERLLGYTSHNLIGTSIFDSLELFDHTGKLVTLEDRPIYKALHKKEKTLEQDLGRPLYYRRKNGQKIPIALTTTPILFKNKLGGAIQIIRDMTREIELDKSRTEFVSLASHQLRTPTSAINWYTEAMLSGDLGKLSEKQRVYLEQLGNNSKRIIRLVNDLLSVSQIELGTFVTNPELVDVKSIISKQLASVATMVKQKKHTIKERYPNIIAPITTDAKLLNTVLHTIISNAINYTPSKGTISISVSAPTSSALAIAVSDTGPGIPKEEQPKVFSKLFRSTYAQKQEIGGTGLGLYMAKAIVEYIGGTITFSTKPGKGTTFTVTLPLKKQSRSKKAKN